MKTSAVVVDIIGIICSCLHHTIRMFGNVRATHTDTRTHARTHARTHTHTRTHIHTRVHTHGYTHSTYTHTYTHTCTHARTHIHTHTHTHTPHTTHIQHTHIHTHIYTHTHTHTHTHTRKSLSVAAFVSHEYSRSTRLSFRDPHPLAVELTLLNLVWRRTLVAVSLLLPWLREHKYSPFTLL